MGLNRLIEKHVCIESKPTGKHDTSLSMAQLSMRHAFKHCACTAKGIQKHVHTIERDQYLHWDSWIRQLHHSQRSNHRKAEHFVESTRKLHRGGENRKLQHINRYFRATCLWASKKCWKWTWLGYRDTDLENPEDEQVEQEKTSLDEF